MVVFIPEDHVDFFDASRSFIAVHHQNESTHAKGRDCRHGLFAVFLSAEDLIRLGPKEEFHIFFHCLDGSETKVFHQDIRHVGTEEGRKSGAEVNVFYTKG